MEENCRWWVQARSVLGTQLRACTYFPDKMPSVFFYSGLSFASIFSLLLHRVGLLRRSVYWLYPLHTSLLNSGSLRVYHVTFHYMILRELIRGWGCSSAGRASDRPAADAGSILRRGEGFVSQSQLSVQTLLRVSVHLRVQSHASTSVRKLKIL